LAGTPPPSASSHLKENLTPVTFSSSTDFTNTGMWQIIFHVMAVFVSSILTLSVQRFILLKYISLYPC
jgi:hypothetical protein